MLWRRISTLRQAEWQANPFCGWLTDDASLTARLRRACGAGFAVQVEFEGWRRPRLDEARVLGVLPDGYCWVREVRLMCDGKTLVQARTVVPGITLQGRGLRLKRLRNKPLGEFVFKQPGFHRAELQVAPVGAYWGRRSVMWLYHKPLLVTEVFLPAVLELR